MSEKAIQSSINSDSTGLKSSQSNLVKNINLSSTTENNEDAEISLIGPNTALSSADNNAYRKSLATAIAEIGLEDRIEKLDSSSKKTADEIKGIQKKFEKYETKLEEQQSRSIETLGIFISIFTFISAQVQILSSDVHVTAASGLTLILLGGLIMFILLINYVIRTKLKFSNEPITENTITSTISNALSAIGYTVIKRPVNAANPKTWANGHFIAVGAALLIILGIFLVALSPEKLYKLSTEDLDKIKRIEETHKNLTKDLSNLDKEMMKLNLILELTGNTNAVNQNEPK